MSKSWTPEELAAASAAMKAEGHMSYEEFCAACCGWNTEAATAGIAPSTSAMVGSMSMSTRAGADLQTSARSRATPLTASPATLFQRERSLSSFRSGIHGIFERKAQRPRASTSLAAVGELQHALCIVGG